MRKAIAIDFDGCLCTEAFPAVGQPNWPVIEKAKQEQQSGAGLILWTVREGPLLQAAVDACREWGLEFDAVNESLPDWIEAYNNRPRKVGASEYWDDKGITPSTLNGTYVSIEWFNQVNAELQAIKEAEAAGRLVMLPDAKYTDADGEKALQKAMWTCGNTNNPVTRYTADAIAEKLCREAKEENPALTLEQLREMDGEPVWVSWAGHSSEGWALVRVWSKANSTIYLTYHNGATDLLEYILSNGAKIYRRKPEVGV